MGIWAAVKYALNSTPGTSSFLPLDEFFVVNAILSDDDGLNEWGFRQNKIGEILNVAFELNSAALAGCNTMSEVVANSQAMSAIASSTAATLACIKNDTFLNAATDEMILGAGAGYKMYSVGDTVTLKYGGADTVFRVVHKDYMTKNKIVLMSEKTVASSAWYTTSANNYQPSTIRQYLNSTVLSKFASNIQSAIVTSPVECHNGTTAVTCNDKIWAPSYTEVGLGTNSYAPAEGSALSYFASATERNKGTTWWLRTPYTNYSYYAWIVKSDGASRNNYVTYSFGVVPCFEI